MGSVLGELQLANIGPPSQECLDRLAGLQSIAEPKLGVVHNLPVQPEMQLRMGAVIAELKSRT